MKHILKVGMFLLAMFPHLSFAAEGEIRIGVGMALNNRDPTREEIKLEEEWPKGGLIDASAVWKDAINNVDLQLSGTYVGSSNFGTEQAVALTFLGGQKFQYGAGLLVSYSQGYEKWQRDYVAPDPVRPRECTFCGYVFQVGYEYKRVQLQVRYWRTDYNFYPGHNGALVLGVVRL